MNPVLGDMLVLLSAVGYATSNVFNELTSKKTSDGNIVILAMFGLFCPFINALFV